MNYIITNACKVHVGYATLYLVSPNIRHVAETSYAVHADHVVGIHLSAKHVVHDLLSERPTVISVSQRAHKLKKKHSE